MLGCSRSRRKRGGSTARPRVPERLGVTEDVGWSLGAGAGNGPSGLAGGRLSAQPSGHWGLGRRASAGACRARWAGSEASGPAGSFPAHCS